MIANPVLWTLMAAGAFGPSTLHDAHRGQLAGQNLGSLAQPQALSHTSQLRLLCRALQTPLSADPEEETNPQASHERARARVYTVRLDPAGFSFGRYDADNGQLKIKLDHTLTALDGGLSLSVLDRNSGSFELKPGEAAAVQHARRGKRAEVEVSFLVDYDGGDLNPCFGLPHSDSFSLVIMPLTWTIRDGASGAQLASLRTSAQLKLTRWVKLAAPELAVSVIRSAPGHDDKAVREVFAAASDNLKACFAKGGHVVASQMAALSLTVSAAGKVADAHSELSSQLPAEAEGCLVEAATKLSLPKSARGGKVGVLLALER